MGLSCDDVVPLRAFTPVVLTKYLALIDSRDKMVKGIGNFFKILATCSGNPNYAKMSAACSDARSVMRLCVWFSNIKKIDDAANGSDLGIRTMLFILRVILDGFFSSMDNVSYVGQYFYPKHSALIRVSSIGRGCLFWGYVFAALVDAIDLSRADGTKKRINKALTLTRNVFDMVSTVGNVFPVDIGVKNAAVLGFLSAVIATREQLMVAAGPEKTVGQKA